MIKNPYSAVLGAMPKGKPIILYDMNVKGMNAEEIHTTLIILGMRGKIKQLAPLSTDKDLGRPLNTRWVANGNV